MEIKKNFKKLNKTGFSLIELIIVIAIIGIITLIAIPKFGSAQKDAKINADLASAKTIANAASAKIAKGEEVTNIEDVASEIQGGIPKPKAVDGDFSIDIDENGNVTVKAGDKTIYPSLATDSGK